MGFNSIVTIYFQTPDHPGGHAQDEAGERSRKNRDFA